MASSPWLMCQPRDLWPLPRGRPAGKKGALEGGSASPAFPGAGRSTPAPPPRTESASIASPRPLGLGPWCSLLLFLGLWKNPAQQTQTKHSPTRFSLPNGSDISALLRLLSGQRQQHLQWEPLWHCTFFGRPILPPPACFGGLEPLRPSPGSHCTARALEAPRTDREADSVPSDKGGRRGWATLWYLWLGSAQLMTL